MTTPPFSIAGISLDCGNPSVLIEFYVRVLGGGQLWSDDAGAGMRTGAGLILVAQKVADYTPPSWPGSPVVHLDLDAGGDVQQAVERAVGCGARLADNQPDPRWAVLLDPAGHPFCITTMVWSDQPGS